MEEVYPIEDFPNVSQPIDVRGYFSEYFSCLSETFKALIDNAGNHQTLESKIQKAMGITSAEVEELNNRVDLSFLDSEKEETKSPIKTGRRAENPEALLLEKATRTLATAVELKAAKSRRIKYTTKLKDIKSLSVAEFEREETDAQENQITNAIILIARVYKPFHSHTVFPKVSPIPRMVSHEQDIMLHGSQTLDKFRDRITCINDEVIVGDRGSHEEDGSRVPVKQLFTSGMFLFGDTFYCDFRDTVNKDYGRVIDDWAKARPEMHIGPFKHASMEDTLVSDLKIRLGFPYVYVHLGTCEHLITFMDARLMSATDVRDIDRYPLVEKAEAKPMYCTVCDTYPRGWVVEDDRFPTKTTFLCKQCFDIFYIRNGQRTNPPYCCKVPNTADNDG